MNIKLQYEITSEGELYEIYGSVAMIIHLKQAKASMPYYIQLEKDLSQYIPPFLKDKLTEQITQLTKHPESELNYHLDKAREAIDKNIKLV